MHFHRYTIKTSFWQTLSFILMSVSCSTAASNQNDMASLRSEIEQLKQLVLILEQKVEVLSKAKVPIEELSTDIKTKFVRAESAEHSSVTLNTDFRMRYDSIRQDSANDRERARLRARASLTYSNDQFTGVLGASSGDDNPVVVNQTLGQGGNTKGLQLDLAYINYPLSNAVNLIAGKMKNPLYRPGEHGLVWDSDYRPEGIIAQYRSQDLSLTGGFYWLESDSVANNEAAIYLIQAKQAITIGARPATLGFGYSSANIAGHTDFWEGDNLAVGNLRDCSSGACVFANDYHVFEGFAEVQFSSLITGFAHGIKNLAVSDNNIGYALGVEVGNLQREGDWSLKTIWQDLENESTLAFVSDSRFGGGGTGGEGVRFILGYQLSAGSNIDLIYSKAKRHSYLSPTSLDYERLIVDFAFKY